MSIIREAKIEDTIILTASGNILSSKSNMDFPDLFEEESKRAFFQGQQEGEKIGYEKAHKEVKALIYLLQTMIEKVLEQKAKLLDQLKPEIVEFCISICERIVRREFTQPEALVKLINSLLTAAGSTFKNDFVQIFISPDDLILLQGYLDKIHYDIKELGGIRISSDSLMKRANVRIESKTGLLNYDISRELSDLQAKVLQR